MTAKMPAEASIQCRVLQGASEILLLRNGWEALRKTCASCSPNADIDRYLAVAELLEGSTPFVIAAEQGETLVGLLVGRVTKGRLQFRVGYLPVPTPRLTRLDVVYQGLLAQDNRVQQAIIDTLLQTMRARNWHVVQFSHLADDLAQEFRLAHAGSTRSGTTEIHWVWDIAQGSYEETLQRYSRKHRYNLRRYDKLLCDAFDQKIEIRWVTQPNEVEVFVKEASSITSQSYQQSIGAGVRDTDVWRAIVRAEAQAGRLRSCVLYAADKPIAYQFGTVYGEIYFLEAMTYDQRHQEHRPGAVLLQRTVQALCEAGDIRRIDYGFGDAAYKKTYGTSNWDEQTIRLYADTFVSRAVSALDGASAWAAEQGRRWQAKSGVMSRVKRAWRKRMHRKSSEKS